MKVLLSAIACDPWAGSENYFGWAAVQCLAQDHDLWVLTSKRNRPSLESAKAKGLVPPNVRFIYAGRFKEWHGNRLLARFQSWKEYTDFARSILPIAKELHRAVSFDLAHHVTFATWRVASPLWKLKVPFILGPVGGNERFPIRCFSLLSPSAAGFEFVRGVSNFAARVSPTVRTCIRQAAGVFVANAETEDLIKQVRGSDTGVSRLMAAFYPGEKVRSFAGGGIPKDTSGELRLFAGGNLEGRKGVALALHALAAVQVAGLQFRYMLGGRGPESQHLQDLASGLGMRNRVVFGEPLSGEAYQSELGFTHVYLLPSLRDSAPLTLMEAMLARCVPVVADCGGPAQIVTQECGYKVRIADWRSMVEDLANAILAIARHREIILQKGAAAQERIATSFTEENYRRLVNAAYATATGKRRDTGR